LAWYDQKGQSRASIFEDKQVDHNYGGHKYQAKHGLARETISVPTRKAVRRNQQQYIQRQQDFSQWLKPAALQLS
jgi:hypothetical protein